jgi:hypothetical protein
MKNLFSMMTMVILIMLSWSSLVTTAEPDTEPPVITFLERGLVAETWAHFYWATDEPALGGLEWGRTSSYENIVRETGNYSTEHYINLTGLKRGTEYQIRIFATDEANNTGYFELELGTFPIGVEEEWDDVLVRILVFSGFVVIVLVVTTIYFRKQVKKT